MKIDINPETNIVSLEFVYPLQYGSYMKFDLIGHEELAKVIIAEKDSLNQPKRFIPTMVLIESETLEDDLWENPDYMKKTNNVIICEAREEVRRTLINRYMDREELDSFIDKNALPTWKYNDRDQPSYERKFKYELEEAIFEYQEDLALVDIIETILETSKYVLDEELYPIMPEDEDCEEPLLESDPDKVKRNRNQLLERHLKPRVGTTFKRVYAMPHPLNHWDCRSYWHQFFCIEDLLEEQTTVFRGNWGGSGSREINGRMAHTFAHLTRNYGVVIPTYHLCYTGRNQLEHIATYNTFKCFPYDLVGNYPGTHKNVDILFDGMIIPTRRALRECEARKKKNCEDLEDEDI